MRRGAPARAAGPLAGALLLLLAPASALDAQTLSGTVVDADTRRPLPGVSLELIADPSGAFADSTASAADGTYALRATSPGGYLVRMTLPGWADYTSETVTLAAGAAERRELEYRRVSLSALRRMADAISGDARLQLDLRELCGEELRPWESGIVVGVVRERRSDAVIAGAVVRVGAGDADVRETVSGETGTYVLCNVELGDRVPVRVRAAGWEPREIEVEVRAGMIGWYDLYLRPLRR